MGYISEGLLYFLLLFSLVSSVQSLCHPNERSALLQFKESFVINNSASSSSDAYSKTESWKLEEESGDCCWWKGVDCDNTTGHVIALDLSSCYLYGSINSSSSLFRLVHLELLNLADNVFNNSEIPSEISNLQRLRVLDLSYSNFSGQIPSEILELSELELLDLSGNSLKLRKPGLRSLLENLTNLKELRLADVRISSLVPNISAKFSSLTTLILSNCDLRGEFPTGNFELPSLQFLSLQSNQELTGCLPDIQGSHPLLKLSLADTSFAGQLPESIGNFKSLEYLDFSNCNFSGKVPYSVGNLTELNYLDLSSNNFWGPIPPSVGNLNQLTTLDFSSNNFSGEIPSSVAHLTQLVYLSLANNNFNPGTLSWLGSQTNLAYLDLTNTSLTGNIPSSLRNLTQISTLYLWANKLDGQIPPWIGNLTKLTEIKVQENILSGSIPESIFNLENLEVLYLQNNQLNGTLKLDSFLELKNLTRLQLSGNYLSLLTNVSTNGTPPKFNLLGLASCNLSEFPSFLSGQDELMFLELSENKIHDQIPNWFWSVGKNTLQYLNLGFNFLTGFQELPVVLPWTSLEVFSLEFNKLKGSLPHPPPSIISYSVSNNFLSGEIPPMLCNISSVAVLDLSTNNLTGMLRPCLGNLSDSLKVLNLRHNHFTGAIPPTYMKNCRLRMMDLSQNQLQGRIPRSLARCPELEVLNLGNNLINDTFPSWLGTLPKLKVLILRANRLHGVIGKSLGKSEFSKLQIIDLSDNSLRGNLPSQYFNIWNAMKVANTNNSSPYMNANTSFQNKEFLWSDYYNYVVTLANKGRDLNYESVPDSISAIDLSSNEFQGAIPEAIGNLKLIRMLNLSNNNLTGHIPSSLGEISNLESLDLSRNKLLGKIPPQLAKLNFLETFNVSYNNLEGPIPPGAQFNTFNNDSYEGNSRLCGYPLSDNCGNPEPLPPTPLAPQEDEGIGGALKFGWKIVLIGYGGGLIIGISLGCNFTARKHEWLMKFFRKGRMSK
ncbi:receptor-like protein 12 [Durio zibethinus]|uniref:Receptor-like protein 12 n=1 Tax=Durio zibethinus TaxID=66656 RepID=A0A6P6B4P8_DURZI|nr:receptor-like protein 12 [Durio zibethinus]